MLETSRVWLFALAAFAGACAMPEVEKAPEPVAAPPAPVAQPDPVALGEAARAMLAQAETDVQRARAKRALWLKAWESLVAARQAAGANDNAAALQHARRASEFARLGLEQLAYPALD